MRVIILTSHLEGLASLCIPYLADIPEIEIVKIVYNEGRDSNVRRELRRKIKKTIKIGILGAMNGIRMRRWFGEDAYSRLNIERLDVLANRLGVHFETTPTINCQRTVDLFAKANAVLGVSLGNGYIGRRIFSIPKHGMINIHHEILPEFQGAQSIIWQVYEGTLMTGYTIHQIDRRIDTGDILYQERISIDLRPTLRETVSHNCARLYEASAKGLVNVIINYPELVANAVHQRGGRSFTTPTFWQYLQMVRQHRRLYREHIHQPNA